MSHPALAVENLGFSYPGGKRIFSGVTFSIESGETLAIIGPNGAGKTTLLLHLNGLLQGEGQVAVFGRPVNKKTLPEIRARVGLVFQDPNDQLFMPTIWDDVAFGPRNLGWTEERVAEKTTAMLRLFRLEKVASRSSFNLSLGERKRASLASVMVLEPDILVLDEPSAGLDPGCRRSFIELLQGLPQTKVIASHDLDLVGQTCTKTLLLAPDGTKIFADTATTLSDRRDLEKYSL